jgi:predicted Zn-dependent protease
MPVIVRREAVLHHPAEPVKLLDMGVAERDAGHWDYALVITEAELKTYDKPFAMATPSNAVNVAVLSTSRLDPAAWLASCSEDERIALLERRIVALAMHQLGHLNGLHHRDDPKDFMHDVPSPQALDKLEYFGEETREAINRQLDDVADLRLEESAPQHHVVTFYLRAAWHDRGDILAAVRRIRPWVFPVRFSRLTTAAASTMVVLLITAEAWDLAMSQSVGTIVGLSAGSLAVASSFLLERQHLLSRLRKGKLSEQRVVSNVSMVVGVFLGMAVTYALLFVVTLGATELLFSKRLVKSWAASLDGNVGIVHYLTEAGFVASLGILIGALGASFEEEGYFRHVAIIDEET